MTIKTILVPTDFSEASVVALVYAKQLADALRASIHLLHVTQDPTAQPWAEEAYPASLSEIFGQLKAQARRNLTRAAARVRPEKIPVRTRGGGWSPVHRDHRVREK